MILWRVFLVFLPLSFLTVGGGQSVIAGMHRQTVDVFGWMTDARFVELYALSRLSPGPGSVLASMVGWEAAGIPGAIVASIGIFVPSSLLVYGLARVWARHRGAAWQGAVEAGLAPVAAGLVLAASWTLLRAAPGGWLAWAVAGVSAALLLTTRTSPFLLLAGGALVFVLAGP